ncbi:hypothetical protein C1Y19_26840 [Pseudomonas sp. MPR-LB3]|nr:hypothetical protein C1Y17_31355 [Pseudomonas sp. MPR-R2A6]PNA39201.1 hypothetical protein C1Y15_27880 [Pseudomonas sp. MPR-LB5]PNA68444.1 hypothetical protein C1Y19_26840 [Pseudomonas sp. MPR-LB3]
MAAKLAAVINSVPLFQIAPTPLPAAPPESAEPPRPPPPPPPPPAAMLLEITEVPTTVRVPELAL